MTTATAREQMLAGLPATARTLDIDGRRPQVLPRTQDQGHTERRARTSASDIAARTEPAISARRDSRSGRATAGLFRPGAACRLGHAVVTSRAGRLRARHRPDLRSLVFRPIEQAPPGAD
jgi:hypothetical protein